MYKLKCTSVTAVIILQKHTNSNDNNTTVNILQIVYILKSSISSQFICLQIVYTLKSRNATTAINLQIVPKLKVHNAITVINL